MITIHRLKLNQLTKNKLATYTPLLKPGFTPLFNPPNLLDPKNKDIWAFLAERDSQPVGLLIATSLPAHRMMEIQSFFALPGEQEKTIRLQLVEALKQAATAKKYRMLLAVYPNEAPFTQEWEEIFIQSQWEGKKLVMLECFYGDCQQFHPAWFEKKYTLEPGFEIFPWKELKPSEAEEIKQNWKYGAVPQIVYPFLGDASFEPITSLGLRYHGKVVAWIITRAVSPTLLCYYSIYCDYDLQKKGYVMMMLIESIKRQQRLSPFTQSIFQVNTVYVTSSWIQFVRRRLAPYTTKFTEYWQAWHSLLPPNPP